METSAVSCETERVTRESQKPSCHGPYPGRDDRMTPFEPAVGIVSLDRGDGSFTYAAHHRPWRQTLALDLDPAGSRCGRSRVEVDADPDPDPDQLIARRANALQSWMTNCAINSSRFGALSNDWNVVRNVRAAARPVTGVTSPSNLRASAASSIGCDGAP